MRITTTTSLPTRGVNLAQIVTPVSLVGKTKISAVSFPGFPSQEKMLLCGFTTATYVWLVLNGFFRCYKSKIYIYMQRSVVKCWLLRVSKPHSIFPRRFPRSPAGNGTCHRFRFLQSGINLLFLVDRGLQEITPCRATSNTVCACLPGHTPEERPEEKSKVQRWISGN